MPATPAAGTPEITKGPEAEAPSPFNQGALGSQPLAPHQIVAESGRPWKGRIAKRTIIDEPSPGRDIDGRRVRAWHRTDTSVSGQRRGLGVFYTDVAIEFEDGDTEYAIVMTKGPL